jgi:hypothetical protein
VAVIEAGGICCGATTGHTTVKVSAQHGLIYDTLSSNFGEDGARAYANLAAVDLVEAMVCEHGIASDRGAAGLRLHRAGVVNQAS